MSDSLGTSGPDGLEKPPRIDEGTRKQNNFPANSNVENSDNTILENKLPAADITTDTDCELVPDAAKDGSQYLTGIKLVLVLTGLTTACFVMMLDMSILGTATPQITNDFNSLPDLGWYAASFQLASGVLQPLTGKIYAVLSSKWVFLAFFLIFELGSLVCGVAQNSATLIVGRTIAGLGTAGIQNGATLILTTVAPKEKTPILLGIVLGIGQLGVVSGPLLGGAFTSFTTWRWCFYINLPIGGVVALFLILIHIPDHNVKPPLRTVANTLATSLDLAGFALFAGCVTQLLLALHWGGSELGWSSSTVIGLFVGSAVNFGVWLAWNWRGGDAALLPGKLVLKKVIMCATIVAMGTMASTVVAAYFFPVYFQAVRGKGPFESGVLVLPSILSQLIVGVISGIAMSKTGYYTPSALLGAIVLTVGYGMGSTMSPSTSQASYIGYQILMGAGRGMMIQVPILAVQNADIPAAHLAQGISFLTFGQNLGGAIWFSVANTIFGNGLVEEIAARAPEVDPRVVIAAGATAFRHVVPPESVEGIIAAYAIGVDRVFYLLTGMAGVSLFIAWPLGFKSIKGKKTEASKA